MQPLYNELQELLASIYNSSVITHEQCIPRVAQAQYVSYLQNFSRHEELHNFWKLECELYSI